MRYFLCIHLFGFYCRVFRKKNAKNRYFVVHRDKSVLCASEPATDRGIQAGMPLSEAKAILREGVFLAWGEDTFRDAQEAWLDVCAEFADVIEPEDQHLAFIDLSGHPDPAEIALRLASELKRRLGYELSLGMASTKWIARLACAAMNTSAHAREVAGWEEEMRLREPVLDSAGFISNFPVTQLLPVPQEHRRRLHFLGYRTIGDVTALSLSTLKGHFGEDGLRIYQAAWGGCFEPVRSLYPRDAIQEKISFEGLTDSREAVESGLKHLAQRFAARLIEQDLQCSEMRVWIDFEESEPANAIRTFTKPMQTSRSIFAGLCLVVDSLLVGCPTCIRVQLANLSKVKLRQSSLYGEAAGKAIEAQTAMSRVRKVFGDHVVQLGSEVAEPRRKRLMRMWKDATGWR